MEKIDGWYSVREVGNRVWAIEEQSPDPNLNFLMYLIAGNERALLIDSGWGFGNLATLVATLTPLPVTVALTHAHCDHIFGAMQFPEVYLNELELSGFNECYAEKWRIDCAQGFGGQTLPEDFSPEVWIRTKAPKVLPLSSGQRFDLGGRIIDALTLPGHTPGGVVFFEDQDRFLITGDTLLQGEIWMHLDQVMPLRLYWQNLCGLKQQSDRFDRILPGHVITPVDGDILDEFIKGIGEILEGKISGEPYHTFAGDGMRCWFGRCGVVYRPDRL